MAVLALEHKGIRFIWKSIGMLLTTRVNSQSMSCKLVWGSILSHKALLLAD